MIDLTTCPPPAEPRELLQQFALTGHEAPFEEIVRRYGGMVFGICYDVTRSRQDAEDATQAAFLTLAVQVRCGQTIHAVGPWLQQVARRMSLDINRSRKRRRAREDNYGEAWQDRQETLDADGSGNGFGQAPDSAAGWDELRGIIRQEVHQLPPKYRMPLILHYYGGLSREDMARELGCRANTLGVRLHRARQMLGKRLARRGVTLASVVVGALMAEIVRESVTAHLIQATAQAAAMLSAGHASAGGLVSASIIHMARTAGRALAVARLKLAATLTLIAGSAMAAGADFAAQSGYLNLPALQTIHRKVKDIFQWPWSLPAPQLRVASEDAPPSPAGQDDPAPPAAEPRQPVPTIAIQPDRAPADELRPRPARFNLDESPWWSGISPVPTPPLKSADAAPPALRNVSPDPRLESPPPQPAVARTTPSSGGSFAAAGSRDVESDPAATTAAVASVPRPRHKTPQKIAEVVEPHPVRPQPPPAPLNYSYIPDPAHAIIVPPEPHPADEMPAPGGGAMRDGWLVVGSLFNKNDSSAALFNNLAAAKPADNFYRIDGQQVGNSRMIVGRETAGAVYQNGGTHTVDRMVLASQSGGRGVYQLDMGQFLINCQPESDPMPNGLVIAGAGEGTFLLGSAGSPGAIAQTGTGKAPDVTIGSALTARGTLRGWGTVSVTGTLFNNGQVVADGYGHDRTLDLTSFSAIRQDFKNRDDRGWYARNRGRLDLPPIPTQSGTSSYTWGDSGGSAPPSFVNAARLTLHDAPAPGQLIISLLSADRTDIPQFPAGHTLIGVWSIDATAADGTPLSSPGGVDLLVRYDSKLAADLGLQESVLKLWTFESGGWIRHDFDPSFMRDPSKHTVGAHLDNLDFDYFAVSAPEPGALTLAAVAAGIALMRRRRSGRGT